MRVPADSHHEEKMAMNEQQQLTHNQRRGKESTATEEKGRERERARAREKNNMIERKQ